MKNIILAVLCTTFAVTFYVVTLSFPSPAQEYRSPSVYPRVIIGAIIILSIVLLVTELLRKHKSAIASTAAKTSIKLPMQILTVMAVYFGLMQVVGFCVATFVFLLVTFLAFGGRVRPGTLFAAGMTAAQYIVFGTLLNVQLYDPVVTFVRHWL